MPKFLLERYDPDTHRNHMPEVDELTNERGFVVVVTHGRYRLEFLSLAQIDAAIAYFEKPNVATRASAINGDHWEFQSWISRLPKGINNSKNRARILGCLSEAKTRCGADAAYVPVSS